MDAINSIEDLLELADMFDRAGDDFHHTLVARLAAKTEDLTHDQFESQEDPYGEPWQPSERALAARGSGGGWFGFGYTLIDNGDLLLSFYTTTGPEGFALISLKKYAHAHQYGVYTGGWYDGPLPVRRMIPQDDLGWGLWEEPMRDVEGEVVQEFFGPVFGGALVE